MDDESTDSFDLKMANDEVDIFQTLASNQMSSSMNERDQQCIQKIETYLANSFKEYSSASTLTSNALFQNNEGGTNNIEEQEQFEQINNDNSAMNSNLNHMDIDDVDKKSEQISLNTNITANDEQYIDEHNDEQTSLPLTTDDTYTGEQQMNALEYCRQFLEIFTLAVNTMEPVLINWAIPAKTGDYYLKKLPVPLPNEMNVPAQDLLNKLLYLLQTGTDILSSFHPVCHTDDANHTDPIGKQSNETSATITSAPSEHSGNRFNQDIQALTSTVAKDPNSVALSLSLSQLFAQAKTIVQELKLPKLWITEQPKQLWKKHTINCLKKKWCTAIQGRSGTQRHGVGIKWSKLTNCIQQNLFILVQLLSHDNHPHPTNVLVPIGTMVEKSKSSGKRKSLVQIRSTLDNLIIEDTYGFDRKTKTILCPVTNTEYRLCKKNLQVIMFSLYKTSEELANTDDAEDLADNEEADDNGEDSTIEDELRKLSKLRICLCRRTDNGELEYVSNYIDTELIEESKGTKPLAIDKVTPEYLCKCGNETITVTLNTDSEKSGFVVRLNNTPLNSDQIRGVTKKQVFFNSRPKTIPEQNYLNVKVSKKSIYKTIKQNVNPYNGLLEDDILPDFNINYVEHSDNPHVHKIMNTELSIQSNEIGPM